MRRYASMQERIIANTALSDYSTFEGTRCWVWLGKRSVRGDYGHINVRVDGRHVTRKAHIVALETFRGVFLQEGEVCMHLCNVSLCCNPMHLRTGTQSENMQYCVATCRHNSALARPTPQE